MAQKRKDWNGLISGFKASGLVFLDESGCNTDMTRRSPGCGSQRLLRCRSHPAGRGPNSSSLFPPLAAVVAVAPRGGAAGVSVRSEQDERRSDWSKTIVPRYRGQRSTSFCDMRNLSGQLRVARLANGSPFGRAGAPAPERAISASR